MKILTINAGSSSLKASLFEKTKELVQIQIDGISRENCKFSYKSGVKNIGQKHKFKNHTEALKYALELLIKHKAVNELKEIEAVPNVLKTLTSENPFSSEIDLINLYGSPIVIISMSLHDLFKIKSLT